MTEDRITFAQQQNAGRSMGGGRNATGLLLLLWLFSTMSLWFFAFYESSAETPEWVRRAQAACFGSDETGLPAPAGWMLLILSPAMLLGAIGVALGKEALNFLRNFLAALPGRSIALALAILVLAQASWVAAAIRERVTAAKYNVYQAQSSELPAGYPQRAVPAAGFSLVDQHGQTRSLEAFHGSPLILSFVFAHCKTVCPGIVSIARSARPAGPDAIPVVFITLDPWRDTPAALPALAKKWNLAENEFILSGPPADVNGVLDAYHVARQRDEKNGDVLHPALVYVIGAKGELAYTFNNPSTEWLREALRRLKRVA